MVFPVLRTVQQELAYSGQQVADGSGESGLIPQTADVGAVSSSKQVPASGWKQAPAIFERRMFTDGELTMADGEIIRFWGFDDPNDPHVRRPFPSPVIRVREGESVHVKLELEAAAGASSRSGASGARLKSTSHIYQWQPRSAGTWLYQSHESSLQQFEMGLFGLLIVDPEPDLDNRVRAYRDGPVYDVERCYIFDDVDPQWHQSPAAVHGPDATFDPRYFFVSGVPNVDTHSHPSVAIEARPGDKILIRCLNASFSLMRSRIEGLRADIISVDGKPLHCASKPWSRWSPVHPAQPVYMATGARHDILIDLAAQPFPVVSGTEFEVTFEFLDWAKRGVRNEGAENPLHVGRATTRIRVL